MKRFAPILKRLNEKLQLPQPTKSRILLEIATDLDDLYNVYRNNGLSEEQAVEKAKEKIELTDDALEQLINIHQSAFRKWMDKISEQAQTRWERIVLILILSMVVAMSGKVIFTTSFFLPAGGFVVPVIGIAFIAIILLIINFYNLYIKKDHIIKKLRSGLFLISLAGSAVLSVSVFGYFMEFISTEGQIILPGSSLITVVCTKVSTPNTIDQIRECFVSSSSVMMVGLFITFVIALFWFVFLNKIVKIEQAEMALLLREL